MPIIRSDDGEAAKLTDHSTATGQTVRGRQLQMRIIHFERGGGAELHAHPHEQMVFVVSGRLRAVSGEDEAVVGPGDVIYHPANVPHQVEALEDTRLVSCKPLWDDAGSA